MNRGHLPSALGRLRRPQGRDGVLQVPVPDVSGAFSLECWMLGGRVWRVCLRKALSVQGEEQLSVLCLDRALSNIPCHRTVVVVVYFFYFFETMFRVAQASLSHSVGGATPELVILLCPLPQCWEHMCAPWPALPFSHLETGSPTAVQPPDPLWQHPCL